MAFRVLVVGPNPEWRSMIERWLRRAGLEVDSVATFEAARPRLTATGPDALLSAVRLGEFNGLHLAIMGRDRRPTLVAIVVGASDAVLAKEAERHGATYLNAPVTEGALVTKLTALLHDAGRQRRWPRKQVAETVEVEYEDSTARIVDLSYGGVRLEVPHADASALERGSRYRVNLPAFQMSIDVELVWAQPGPSGVLQCGAAVNRTTSAITSAWKQVVDRVGYSIQ
jgi:DNA-binding response OmpR family regulator